jgi:hypothetical protein
MLIHDLGWQVRQRVHWDTEDFIKELKCIVEEQAMLKSIQDE